MLVSTYGLSEGITQQSGHIARLHLLVGNGCLTGNDAVLLCSKGILHIILRRSPADTCSHGGTLYITNIKDILHYGRGIVSTRYATAIGSTLNVACVIAVGYFCRSHSDIARDTTDIRAGARNPGIVHTAVYGRVCAHIGSDTRNILLGRDLTVNGHVAYSSIFQICEKSLICGCGIVDIEAANSMSLTIKHTLICLGSGGASNRRPYIVTQIDVGSQNSLCGVLSAIHPVGKPSQFCAGSNLIDTLCDSRLRLCLPVPCCSIGSSQRHVEGLLTLCVIGNGIGLTTAAIASL